MRRGTIKMLLAAAASLAGPAFAQMMTLPEAMVEAYRTNPSLRADREGLKILDEDVAAARSQGRPTIMGEASLARSEIDVVGTGGIVGARINQPLFRGFRVLNNVKAAETNVRAGRESLRQSEMDILAGIAENYSAVLRDQEIVGHNTSMIDILGSIRKGEQRRLDLGDRTRTDVSQADARLAEARATISRAQQRLSESRANFRSLVGTDPGALAPLPPLPPLPGTRDEAIAIALNNSPRIRQKVIEAEVAKYQVRAAKGALLPTLDAMASINHRDEIVQILNRKIRQDYATFQLVLSVPFFQGGAEYAAVRRAKHTENVRIDEIEETTRDVYAATATAWDRLMAARDARAALLEAIRANEAAVGGVRREALGGSRTTLDVLDAERELRDARIAYAIAGHDEYVAGFRLIATIGRATAADFSLGVIPYDPNEHYRRVSGRWIGFNP